MDPEDPTHEDIAELVDICMRGLGDITEWKEELVDQKLPLLEDPEIGEEIIISKFLPALAQNARDVGRIATILCFTVVYSQYYHTGEEDYKEAAFKLISAENLEEMLGDDPPTFELVE
jgi:hypothetical protein